MRTLGYSANKIGGTFRPVGEFRLGLIVNPIAGLGGRVGLKGTDGRDMASRALALGAEREAVTKVARALRGFAGKPLLIFTGGGDLGEASCRAAELAHHVVAPGPQSHDEADTRRVLEAFQARELDLILFAGGDGTARLIAQGCRDTPILGIPCGVKMYSGVFARTAAAAGLDVAEYIAAAPSHRRTRDADVLDLDEAALRQGFARPRLFGTARVPATRRLQSAKTPAPPAPEAELSALAVQLARECGANDLVILGPGTTMARIKAALGFAGTLLGVDAVANGAVLARDASQADLLALLRSSASPRVVVGVLGGLGALFGRGNQQIGPAVLRAVDRGNITVVGDPAKLSGLPHLFLDTGDEALDEDLSGYWRIRTGPRRDSVMRVMPGSA